MIPLPSDDVTPPVTKMYFEGEILTIIYKFNCCQKYYFKPIISNLIKILLKVFLRCHDLECNTRPNTWHNGQLIYPFVFNSVEIENIFPIVNIGNTCT